MKKLTPKILNDLIEKIVIYQAEKIDGLYVQRIHIYYHFVGKLSEDDKNITEAEPIVINTRKGVKLTNKAPDKQAIKTTAKEDSVNPPLAVDIDTKRMLF